ncbi:BtrH N-terminal domain-containing protein [Pseudalkalibacillus hwajinpoensis]|uniref:DUF4872 domain-containing protein n=1 Tax=Guptibacillus hwajinpoensis TaxID=208199 RepID=A0A4U1MES1_9BACL|nr:BtrH N-terminal domain-containing protein [Pseudalkalibacillus hwajinpoensis]TKD69769.1 DUF4872 domain-containing protein [Pseudalkalibacillus hwajinpoensis]
MLISKYPSSVGKHCATNSLVEISKYYGNNLSEAMVLGLSKGVSFNYVPFTDYMPRLINLRNPILEKSFFDTINYPFKWNYAEKLNFKKINDYLSMGIPVLILVDINELNIFQLDFNSLGSVGAHTLSIVGYDENKELYLISEYFQKEYIEIKKNDLQKACQIPKGPFFVKNMWAPVYKFEINNLEQKIIKAIKENAESFLFGNDFYGLTSILKLSQEISYWSELPYWKENSYNTYMRVERIGTGGAGFRKLYLEFIKEVEILIPALREASLAKLLPGIISLYKKMSLNFYYVHRYESKEYFKKIKHILEELYNKEMQFWKVAYDVTNKISKDSLELRM